MAFFDTVVYRCPSALVFAVLFFQIITLAKFLDDPVNRHAHDKSHLQRWWGFYMWFPTHILFMAIVAYILLAYNRSSSERRQLLAMNTDDIDDQIENQADDGVPLTHEQQAMDLQKEISLLNQCVIWWVPFIFMSIKLSFDENDTFSWFGVFSLWIIFSALFAFYGAVHGNWLWMSHYEIMKNEVADWNKSLGIESAVAMHKRRPKKGLGARAGDLG